MKEPIDPQDLANIWRELSESYLSTDVVASNRFRRLSRQMQSMIDDGHAKFGPVKSVYLREGPVPKAEPARRRKSSKSSDTSNDQST